MMITAFPAANPGIARVGHRAVLLRIALRVEQTRRTNMGGQPIAQE
jgi:hypothetical protein